MKNLYDVWLAEAFQYIPHAAHALLAHFVIAENIYNAKDKEIDEILYNTSGVGPKTNGQLKKRDVSMAKDIINLSHQRSVRIITMDDSEYPPELKEIYDPPTVLYAKGRHLEPSQATTCHLEPSQMTTHHLEPSPIAAQAARPTRIAVVGARKATAYGKWAALETGKYLAECGAVTVSGMAYGIDAYAHRGALDGKGITVAVLGNGPDICYPSSQKSLMSEILLNGTIVSEFPTGSRARPVNFPRRNRIISGLSKAVILPEASLDSGSLITAEFALDQGREVFAFPGNINSIYSQGTNKLIKEGAAPVISIEKLSDDLGIVNKAYNKKIQALGKDENEMFLLIKKKGINSIDGLTRNSSISPGNIMGLLTVLELKGMIHIENGKINIAI